MAQSQSKALKHWAHIIRQWPVDKVRPESVAFQKLMQNRINRYTGLTPAISSTSSTKPSGEAKQPPTWNEAKELKDVNALYNLLEGRFTKQFPMPEALRHPTSNPSHYDDLVREMEEAPSRSWFGSFMNRVRGSLRLS